MLKGRFKQFPKISEDFQKSRKLVRMLVFALSGAFSQVFQRISKDFTKDTLVSFSKSSNLTRPAGSLNFDTF